MNMIFPFARFHRAARPWGRGTRVLLLGALLLALPAAGARAQGLARRTLVHAGSTRTWFEHLPAGVDGAGPVPLVVALHGFNTTGEAFATLSEWVGKADAAGFIVVFPNGGLTVNDAFGWNDFVFDGGAPDDVGFLLALIRQLKAEGRVDPARVFMTGFSNGGSITSSFAGLHARELAAIAPVSADWVTGAGVPESALHPDAPLPVWLWGGENETFLVGREPLKVQFRRQLQYWVAFDGNLSPPVVTVQPPLTTEVYPGGRAEVRFTEYARGEHAYQPGTSARIWDEFFSRLRRADDGSIQPVSPVPPDPLPAPPTVTISAETPQAFEAGRVPGRFQVTRSGDLSAELTVRYAVGGSAVGGVNYNPLDGNVRLPAGNLSATIRVKPLADGSRQGNTSVKVTLQPGPGYTLGTPTKAKVRIVDGD